MEEQELFDGKYKKEVYLGGGGFSEVWKVTYQKTGATLALKIYKPGANVDTNGVEMLKHEFNLMVDMTHTNLLKPQFFDICNDQPYLVLPYCERGSVSKMWKKMSEEEAWKLLRDISGALAYLHTRTPAVIHQDVKPDNILVAADGTYMLTDFGVSTSLKVKATQSRISFDDDLMGSVGTIAYMPPNKFSRKNLPIFANDVWSLGATVFELLTGELPFGQIGGLLQRKGAEVPDIPDTYSHLLNDTIRSCMDEDPAKRPFAQKLHDIAYDALRHPEQFIPMKDDVRESKPTPPDPTKFVPDRDIDHDMPPQQDFEKKSEITYGSGSITKSGTIADFKTENEPVDNGIPTWLIVLGIVAGIGVGVLLALFL